MKRIITIAMCLLAMMASTSLKAQEVTIPLNPGWTWISYPNSDTLSIDSALSLFSPTTGDIIKSQWGNASYVGGQWRGNFSRFYPGYGYMYKSNLTTSVPFAFAADEAINPNYVPIDWTNATLLSSNDSIGDYQIQFNGEMPELLAGSIIAVDQDTLVHYVFVETVTVNGNTVSMTTSEAYLTDIFANTEFTLATNPNSKSSAQGKVFYPVAVYMPDENGQLHKIDCGNGDMKHNRWNYGLNYDGVTLLSGDNYSVYMEKLNFNFNLDLEVYMSFGNRNESVPTNSGISRWRSRPREINACLLGTFDSELKARCDIEGSLDFDPGYDIWIHNPVSTPNYVFAPFGVPIVVKINSDLYRQVELTASGEISAYTGFTDHAEGRVGFQWHKTSGISPVANFSNTFTLTPPTLEGRGTAEAKVWVFPRFRLVFYDVLGPSFDVKPYLSTTVSGGFREEMLGQGNDFCAWSLDCNAGLDAAAGLSLQFMGYELQNYSTPNWNIVDRLLYHSPKKIQKASVGTGQTRTVSFDVYDRNHLFNMDVLTPLPQFVKFEANGQLSSEYGIAQNGRVTVNWTPANNDILYAKLYDIDGNVMAWDTVMKVGETQGDWVDLGLPSGLLWATCNVGANAPEDYGDYFAWGETQPKDVYAWSTYQYCNGSSSTLTKYCTNSSYGYNGFTDNLTILQSGDDAATAHYGGRMPTREEWLELRDYCTSVWTTRNGVNGRLFTGPNGNTLFLPAAGCRYDGDLYDAGYYGDYWSSSLHTSYPYYALGFLFNSNYASMYSGFRYNGLSVRAVREN